MTTEIIISLISIGLTSISTIVISIITFVMQKRHQELMSSQIKLSQRQILLPLWDYASKIKRISEGDKKAEWSDVIEAANTLELIALCWQSEIIDEAIIKETFKHIFISTWEDIIKYENVIDNITVKGESLLHFNKCAALRYRSLKEEDLAQGNVPRLN